MPVGGDHRLDGAHQPRRDLLQTDPRERVEQADRQQRPARVAQRLRALPQDTFQSRGTGQDPQRCVHGHQIPVEPSQSGVDDEHQYGRAESGAKLTTSARCAGSSKVYGMWG